MQGAQKTINEIVNYIYRVGQQVLCRGCLHRQLEFQLCGTVAVVQHHDTGLSIQHPGKGIALGGELQLLHLAVGQLRQLRLQSAQCGIHAGDRVGGLSVLEVGKFQAGAQRPIASPLFFAFNAKF